MKVTCSKANLLSGINIVLNFVADDIAVVGALLHHIAPEFVYDPVEGEFGVDRSAAGLGRQFADNEFLRPDVYFNVGEYVAKNKAPLDVGRVHVILFIAFGDDEGSLGIRGRFSFFCPFQKKYRNEKSVCRYAHIHHDHLTLLLQDKV